ncbi:30S ribosomal protein S6 [Luteolibacter marinus]|uniref:30S ribosomal protein S6 n=1 Tax=Luteolibacter marinus TaxID=2776705 RepID=UPI001865E2AC|nr:30S ribosomal protein S6 [Luteolibacter marinus]
MSRKYEGLIVLNTKMTEGSVADLITAVNKEFEAEGAKLDQVEELGRKSFAYPSNHLESGHYVNYRFQAEPDAINRIKDRLKLNTQVHLQHFQRVA